MPTFRFNRNLVWAVRLAALLLILGQISLLIKCILFYKIPSVFGFPILVALVAIIDVAIPAAFPSHRLYDQAKKETDISETQLFIGVVIAVVEALFCLFIKDWVRAEWPQLPNFTWQFGLVYIFMILFIRIPGPLMFPMTYEDAHENAMAALEQQQAKDATLLITSKTNRLIAVNDAVEITVAVVANRILQNTASSDDYQTFLLLSGGVNQSALQALPPGQASDIMEARRVLGSVSADRRRQLEG